MLCECITTANAILKDQMTLCTTLLLSYTIIGTTKASQIPRDGLSPSSPCRLAYRGPSKFYTSKECQCGLYYHTKKHTLACLGTPLTFLSVLVSKRPQFQVASVWTYLFFIFLFFFYFSLLLFKARGYGDEGIQPKTNAKTGVVSEG